MAVTAPYALSAAHLYPYEDINDPATSEMWSQDDKSSPVFTVDYIREDSRHPDQENQMTYINLPKIPLRIHSLRSDVFLLGNQFFDTLAILQHLIHRRFFTRRPILVGLQQQHDYRIVQLQTDPEIALLDLAGSLMLCSKWDTEDIPLIFPVTAGIWELIVKAPYLEKLMVLKGSKHELTLREPSKMPKGIVGRMAQVRSVARRKDRWVWWIHMGLMERFPWHHVIKDTAESMSIYQSEYAIIGSHVYEF